ADDAAVGVEHRRAVVVEARGPPFEDRRDDGDAQPPRRLRQRLRGRTGYRLCEVEGGGILLLAEVLGPEELRQADDLGSGGGRFFDASDGAGEVLRRIGAAPHLDEPDPERLGGLGHTARDYLPEGADAAGGSLLTNSLRSSRKTRSISVTERG